MSRSVLAALAAATVFPTLAFGAPFATPASSSFPLLSGTYAFISHEHCQPTLTVSYKSGSVVSIALSEGYANLDAVNIGTLKFAQGKSSGSGTITLNLKIMDGSVFRVSDSGNSGLAWDSPSSQTESESFTQTASKVEITNPLTGIENTDYIYYGKSSGGIAEHAVFGGANGANCMDDFTLDRQ